jgi:hypothetical protein
MRQKHKHEATQLFAGALSNLCSHQDRWCHTCLSEFTRLSMLVTVQAIRMHPEEFEDTDARGFLRQASEDMKEALSLLEAGGTR